MPLANPKAFFDRVREVDLLGPGLSVDEVAGCNAILAACAAWPLAHVAYGLATGYHETAGTMQPVKEFGGDEYLRRNYDVTGRDPDRAIRHGNRRPGDGIRYAGRGLVQLTWQVNYARAAKLTGVDLLSDPNKAMQLDLAARILEGGMREGWFTGRKLADHLPKTGHASRDQFTKARAIINGSDKAEKIAEEAMDFQEALAAGGWA
ncbi:glycoside hydrolase family 19 protein [Caulobacter sp. 1776]|uniref:glycoside hydrolase family 19 protein n=1 Tax=Caulobacter sp. 1776 TaxID=3156420 RepID=UPI003393FC9D